MAIFNSKLLVYQRVLVAWISPTSGWIKIAFPRLLCPSVAPRHAASPCPVVGDIEHDPGAVLPGNVPYRKITGLVERKIQQETIGLIPKGLNVDIFIYIYRDFPHNIYIYIDRDFQGTNPLNQSSDYID